MKDKGYLQDIVEWDVQNWRMALDFWQTHSKQSWDQCSALEIGGRHGGLSLWLALHGAQVICSDVHGPTEQAREKHQRHGVSHLVQYEDINATAIPHEAAFDIILFKSVLGAIGNRSNKAAQDQAIREIYKALKKGGELFFAENLVASPLHMYFRKHYVKWGTQWEYVSIPEMEAFLSSFQSVRYATLGFSGTFGRDEKQRQFLGKLDRLGLDRLVPAHWRYIMVGVAQK